MTEGVTTSNVELPDTTLGQKPNKKKRKKMSKKIDITKDLVQSISESPKDMLTLSLLKVNNSLDEKALEVEFSPIIAEIQEELAKEDEVYEVDWKEALSELAKKDNKYTEIFNEMKTILEKIDGIEDEVVNETIQIFAKSIEYSNKGLYETFNSEVDAKASELSEKKIAEAEKVLAALKTIFVENEINVDTERNEQVDNLKEQVESLEEELSTSKQKNKELENKLIEEDKQSVFEEVATKLSDVEQEKLKTISEGLVYIDKDQYKEKLQGLVEIFDQPAEQKDVESEEEIIEESEKPKTTDVYNRIFSKLNS